MKKKLQKWTEDTARELRALSRDLSRTAGMGRQKAKRRFSGQELPERQPDRSRTAYTPLPDPDAERQELTEELERAVRRAYYKEGGFRFFGLCLQRYASVVLPRETEVSSMWAAGYNSCIQPMLRQLEKLESEMMEICGDFGQSALPQENAALLHGMRALERRAREDGLHLETGWEPEDYRRALQEYAGVLKEQLLVPFAPPDAHQ